MILRNFKFTGVPLSVLPIPRSTHSESTDKWVSTDKRVSTDSESVWCVNHIRITALVRIPGPYCTLLSNKKSHKITQVFFQHLHPLDVWGKYVFERFRRICRTLRKFHFGPPLFCDLRDCELSVFLGCQTSGRSSHISSSPRSGILKMEISFHIQTN